MMDYDDRKLIAEGMSDKSRKILASSEPHLEPCVR